MAMLSTAALSRGPSTLLVSGGQGCLPFPLHRLPPRPDCKRGLYLPLPTTSHSLCSPPRLALLGLYDDNDKGVEAERQGQDLSVYKKVFEAPFLEVGFFGEKTLSEDVCRPETRSSSFSFFSQSPHRAPGNSSVLP